MTVSDDYIAGYQQAIKDLRKVDSKLMHVKRWSISGELKFAPVELSDYLLLKYYRPMLKLKDKSDDSGL